MQLAILYITSLNLYGYPGTKCDFKDAKLLVKIVCVHNTHFSMAQNNKMYIMILYNDYLIMYVLSKSQQNEIRFTAYFMKYCNRN